MTRVRSEGKVDVIVISINMDERQGAEKRYQISEVITSKCNMIHPTTPLYPAVRIKVIGGFITNENTLFKIQLEMSPNICSTFSYSENE